MSPHHSLWVFDLSLPPFNLRWDWCFKNIACIIFFKVKKHPVVVHCFSGKLTVPYRIQSHPRPDPYIFFLSILLPSELTLIFLFKASVTIRSSTYNPRPPHCYVLIFFQGIFWDTLCLLPFLSQFGPRFNLHHHLLQILMPHSQLNYISAPTVTTATVHWPSAIAFTHIACHQVPLPCKADIVTIHILQMKKQGL